MDPFDEGSDLSDLADSDASLPTTPGLALTPQTSPAHRARERSSSLAPASSSSDRKISGFKPSSKRQQKKDNTSAGHKESAGREGKDSSSFKNQNEVDGEKTKRRSIVLKPSKTKQSEASPQPAAASSSGKASTKKGWAYVPVVDKPQEPEPTTVDGKRSRKSTQHFVSSNYSGKAERGSKSTSLDTPMSNDEERQNDQETSAADETNDAKRPRIKINVNAKSKGEQKSAQTELGKVSDEKTTTYIQSPDNEEEDEDDMVQPSRKRKRDQKPMLAGKTSDYEEDEEDGRQPESKVSGQRQTILPKKTAEKNDRKSSKRSKHKDTSDEDDLSDEFKHSGEEDVVMSEVSDEDDFRPAAPAKTQKGATTIPIRRKSEGGPKESKQKAEPRRSTGSAPSKNTVAGLISAYAKPAVPAPQPAKPAAKVAMRKVPSMNLFDNIMGFGSGSKQSTPAKGGATVRPRSSLLGVNTPHGASPTVRPTGVGVGKDGEGSASSATATRPLAASATKTSTTPSNNSIRNGRMVTVDVRGANGEHVTAAEMAIRKEKELYANAHPKGIFDLLEGAEILMQFEDETRRLLEFDPLIARTKLYRASRTEGYPKLIDRIKHDQRKKREALEEKEKANSPEKANEAIKTM